MIEIILTSQFLQTVITGINIINQISESMKNHYFFGALMMLAGLAAAPAQAQDVYTIKASDANQEGTGSIVLQGEIKDTNIQPLTGFETEDGIKFEFSMGEQTNKQQAPGWFSKIPDFRLYAKNTITITAPMGRMLYEVEFSMTPEWYQYGEVTADKGRMVCNGGNTDVTMADKKDAQYYYWSSDEMFGVKSVTFTIGNRTFDDSKAGQFRFTSVDVTLTPEIDMESIFMEGMPMPSFEGDFIDLEQYPMGMADLKLALGVGLQKNPACEEPITIYWNDEPMSYIPVTAGDDDNYAAAPYCRVEPLAMEFAPAADDETGDDIAVDPMMPSLVTIAVSDDPITLPGYYALEIPDGYFLFGGCEVIGTMWFYEIEGEIPEPMPETFKEIVDFAEPSYSEPIDEDTYPDGIQSFTFAFNIDETMPVTVNKACTEKISLRDEKGTVLAEFGVADDLAEYFGDFKPGYILIPYPMYESPAMVAMYFYEDSNFTPGTYELVIPDGFFQLGEEGEVKLEGASLVYTFIDGTSLGAFEGLVKAAVPMPNSNVNVESDDYYSQNGLDVFQYVVQGTRAFAINTECAEPVTITRNGEPYLEAPATADFTGSSAYVEVYGMSMIPGTVALNPSTVAINPPYGSTIRELGTYVVTIPDNFFKAGEFTVEGSTFTYYVVDDTTAVETFKDEQSVTVYNANGIRVLDNAPVESLGNLEKGLYIVNGKKMIMK